MLSSQFSILMKTHKAENRLQSIINHLTEVESIIWHEENL